MPPSERITAVDWRTLERIFESFGFVFRRQSNGPWRDQCYVGSAPGLIHGGCHGDDEKQVFGELCRIVEEAITLYREEGRPLPPSTSGHDLANRVQNVA